MLTNITLASAGTTTVSFTNGIAAIIVILAALGIYGLTKLEGSVRLVALVLIVGVLVANIAFLHHLGLWVRNNLGQFAAEHGHPEVWGDLTFTLLLLGAIAIAAWRDRATKGHGWTWTLIVLVILFFTMSWAANIIVFVTNGAATLLGFVQQIHM
jgi:hypothetical protein